MTDEQSWQTGAILGRFADPKGGDDIAAVIRLPASLWDEMTNFICEMYGDPPDGLPLETRVGEFLELQAQEWGWACGQGGLVAANDDDDDAPF